MADLFQFSEGLAGLEVCRQIGIKPQQMQFAKTEGVIMTDNIKPEHYRTGEIDLYEAWYRTYPFDQYRAIMQAVAERYMRRDKNDRVEDLDKAMETLKRLKEKEIEYAGGSDLISKL